MTRKDAWTPYRRGKAWLWGGFLLFMPATALLAYALVALGAPGNPVPFVAFAWMALWFIAVHRLARFPCPRCGKRFFMQGRPGVGNVWASRCHHCGASAGSSDQSSTSDIRQ